MTTDDYNAADNGLGCWELWLSCMRAQHVAGRKLTPDEMLAIIDSQGGPVRAPERGNHGHR